MLRPERSLPHRPPTRIMIIIYKLTILSIYLSLPSLSLSLFSLSLSLSLYLSLCSDGSRLSCCDVDHSAPQISPLCHSGSFTNVCPRPFLYVSLPGSCWSPAASLPYQSIACHFIQNYNKIRHYKLVNSRPNIHPYG